jgi:hypothetical protein
LPHGWCSPKDQAEQHALADTVRADQAMDLARFKREIYCIGDVQATKMLVQFAKFEQ